MIVDHLKLHHAFILCTSDTLEVQQWCETYHLNRIDQPIEQPFLQWKPSSTGNGSTPCEYGTTQAA